MRAPLPSRSSKVGSSKFPPTTPPFAFTDGPRARKTTFFGSLPVIIIPAMRTLSPVCTRRRVEMFKSCAGVGVGVGVGDGVTVGVAVGLGVAVGVGVGVGPGVIVGVAVGVAV